MNPLVIESIDPQCPAYGPKDDRQAYYAPPYGHPSIPPLFEGYCPHCRRRHPYAIRQVQAKKEGGKMKWRHAAVLFFMGEAFAIAVLLSAAHAFASK